MIYNRNQRTAWGRGLAALRLCFCVGNEVEGGVESQQEGLSGVLSLTRVLNSRIALCLWGLCTRFSGTFIRASPLTNTDHPTDSNSFRWRSMLLTKSTTWDPVIGLFSYISSPFSFQFNTSQSSLILSLPPSRLLARILKVGVQILCGPNAMLLGGSGGVFPQKILKNWSHLDVISANLTAVNVFQFTY